MAKNVTPQMEKINARRMKGGKVRRSTPAKEAWLRLIRNKVAILGLIILILLALVALLAPVLTPYEFDQVNMKDKLQGPSLKHPFGTDQLGRDMLTRCIYGTRITMPIAIFAVVFAILVGGVLGIIIPPSIPMVIYGLSGQQSITKMFMGGVLPGLLIAGSLICVHLCSVVFDSLQLHGL